MNTIMKGFSRVMLLIVVVSAAFLTMQITAASAITEVIQKRTLKPPSLIKKKEQRIQAQPVSTQKFPQITAISPAAAFQGQTASIMINGQYLSHNMVLRLGQGVTVQNLAVLTETGTVATAQIIVAPDAAPGTRTAAVIYKDDLRQTGIVFTVNSLYKPPILRSAAPGIYHPGRTYQCLLTGENLGTVKSIDMGPGIQVKKVNRDIRSDNTLMVEVKVLSNAPPGQRNIKFSDRQGTHKSQAYVTVVAGTAGQKISIPIGYDRLKDTRNAPGPAEETRSSGINTLRAEGMIPNRWRPGNIYHVTVFTDDIEKGMPLDLGSGIEISGINFEIGGLVRMDIKIQNDAKAGYRSLKYKKQSGAGWVDSGLQGMVFQRLAVHKKKPAAIRGIPVADVEFKKSDIELLTPEFGKFFMMENWVADHGIPTSNDAVVFTWKEKNSGLSQWFELRILDKEDHVVMKRIIKGPPDFYFEPDAEFISELFSKFRPGNNPDHTGGIKAVTPEISVSGPAKANLKQNKSETKLSQEEQYVIDHSDDIECFWQVAGFRRYSSSVYQINSGSVTTTGNNVEVAISPKWPLQLPEFSPTGLICSKANTPLTPVKYSEELGKTVEGENFFVGDTLELYGDISVDGCPWSVGYDTKWDQMGSGGEVAGKYKVTGWSFSNLIIDWGDGEWDYVSATPTVEMTGIASKYHTDHSSSEPDDAIGEPVGKIHVDMRHTYRYAQKFPVRLFVLPEDEMGRIGAIVQANKVEKGQEAYHTDSALFPNAFETGTLWAASSTIASDAPSGFLPVSKKKGSAGFSKSNKTSQMHQNSNSGQLVSGLQALGSNAFLLYCEPMIIDIKADPAATGKLHLLNIAVDHFSGQGVDPNAPVDISGLLKKPQSIDIPGSQKIYMPKNPGSTSSDSQEGSASNIQKTTLSSSKKPQLSQTQTNQSSTFYPSNNDAVATACDEGLYATAKLKYFGMGRIHLIWKVDGTEIARTLEDVGPSPVRQELNDSNEYTQDILPGFKNFQSPKLPLDIGTSAFRQYKLTVQAWVEGYEGVSYMPPKDLNPGQGEYLHVPGSEEYIQYVGRESDPKTYLVKGSNPGFPCAFRFPVANNKFFTVSNIQNRVTKKNGKYSGQGTLYFSLPDGPYGMTPYSAEIRINNWQVSDDQVVTDGKISETGLNIALDNLAGLTGVLKSLKGTAGQPMIATLDLKATDTGLHSVGSGVPPQWTGVAAELVPEDGWYAEGEAMPETQIFWSTFRISSNDVNLDLSRLRGGKPKAQPKKSIPRVTHSGQKKSIPRSGAQTGRPSNQGPALSSEQLQVTLASPSVQVAVPAWTGVDLGQTAQIYPYLFHLAEDVSVPAKGWAITGSGIEGQAVFNHFEHVLGDGSISFDRIDISACDQQLDAAYENVQINIPWPKVALSGGDATLHYERGQSAANILLDFDTSNQVVTEDYGTAKMTSRIKSVEHLGSGWGIVTDTTFDFNDSRKDFTQVELTDLFFNVFGEAHFRGDGDQVNNRTIPINETTTLGDASYTISGLLVHAPADHLIEKRLAFTFKGEINFQEDFNSDDVDVMYHIEKPLGKDVICTGPRHTAIEIKSTFPNEVDPLVKIDVKPEIQLSGSQGTVSSTGSKNILTDLFISPAYAATGVEDTFRGEVDATMFSDVDLGVKAAFRYGTYKGNPYWLTHINAPHIDVPIFSGVNLKQVNGGIGHGFSKDVFENDPMNTVPDNPGSTLYSAGVTIGFPGSEYSYIYKLSGQLTVEPEDNVYRMAFNDVRLFGVKLGGGYFEYDDAVFKGNLWGGFSLYKGAISMNIPQNSDKVGLYFDSSKWEIWAGRKENQLELKLFNMAGTQGYYQIGSESGYKVGGGMSFDTGKLCMGIFAAKAWADAQMGISITPRKLDGTFWISAGLKGYVPCSGKIWDGGLSGSVRVDVSAPPLDMDGEVVIDVPDWIPDVPDDVTFRFNIL